MASIMLVTVLTLQVINLSFGARVDITKAAANDLLNATCSVQRDPAFCLQIIKSIPGAGAARLYRPLEQAVLTFFQSEGRKAHDYVQSLVGSAKNPRLKAGYTACAGNYSDAVGNMGAAEVCLKDKDYYGITIDATIGVDALTKCEEAFMKPPTTDPSELPQKNKYFKMLGTIILVIADKLQGFSD